MTPLAALLLAWQLGTEVSAQQQLDMTGTWRAGATAIEVSIESWGTDCGTRPTSTRSNGGGMVKVEQQGQVLLLHGRDQDIRTDTCWSRNPAMKRSAASYSDGLWMTRCRTASDDPREELGIYTLTLQDENTLLYKDVSHYDWALNESKCVATFTTTQTLSRVAPTESQEPEPVASAERSASTAAATRPSTGVGSTAGSTRCRPGPAASISVRPKQAEIEVGQRVCFKARVMDAADCPLPSANVSWQLNHAKSLRGTLSGGCFSAADKASEGEGEFHVVAKHAGVQGEAVVVVKRVDLSALIARRMEGTGLSGLDEIEEPDTTPKAVARIATRTAPAETGSSRGGWMLGLGMLALGLIGVGFWMSRREVAPAHAAADGRGPPTRLDRPAGPAGSSSKPPETWICPTCRIGYPAEQASCPNDGSKLIPYAEFTARQRREQQTHGKRCPKCGKTYPASAGFCGEDGSHLVDQA